ncbi:MAG: AAA family ATPase [Bdellovibrionales bacterium]|nr:AAA family ATPase [Bdellovibrionales bacterium]
MRVSRLEIFGFKSFMERLILPLEGGMTGIVGPNGCGKSNIVDALRWVLGETNARSLRGGLLEDVIFNGTDKLRPLGLAEVSLTLRAEGDSIYEDIASHSKEGELQSELERADADIQRVADTLRTISATQAETSDQGLSNQSVGNAESVGGEVVKEIIEEKIEENTAEQPDLAEKAPSSEAVTRGGRPHLRVIGRGESDTAENILGEVGEGESEESAHSSEVDTQVAMLQKFGWLRGVTEVQVTRRLYRSGESEFFLNRTPCRLRDLKEFFRVVGLSARTFTIVAQGEVSRIITSKPEHRRQIFEEAAGVLGLREKIATAERRLKDTDDNLARLEDIEREVDRQVSSLRRQANRARQREGLKSELLELEELLFSERFRRVGRELQEVAKSLELASVKESELKSVHEEASREAESFRSTLLQAEVQVEELRSNLDALRDAVNERERKEESFRARLHELEALRDAQLVESTRLVDRVGLLSERESSSRDTIKELSTKEKSLVEQLGTLDGSLESKLEELGVSLRKKRDEIKDSERSIQSTRDSLHRVQGESAATRKQLRSDSLYELLEGAKGKEYVALFERIQGELPTLLAEEISINPSYVKAIQAVLGEHASYFIVSKPAELARALTSLQESNGGTKSWFGLIRAFSATDLANKENHDAVNHGVVSDLNKLEIEGVELVPCMSVVDVPPSLRGLLQELLRGVYIVSDLDTGLVLAESGALSNVPARESEEAGNSLVVRLVTPQGELISHYSCSTPRESFGLLDIQQRISELSQTEKTLLGEFETKEGGLKQLHGELKVLEDEHRGVLQEKQEKDRVIRELSNELGTVRGRLASENRVLEQLLGDIRSTRELEKEIENRLSTLAVQHEETSASFMLLTAEDQSNLETEVEAVKERLIERDEERKSLRGKFDELRKNSELQWREIEAARSEVSSHTLTLERAKMEEQHLLESAGERLTEEAFQALQSAREEGFPNAPELSNRELHIKEERVRAIRGQILREGEVDPTSIERFEEESLRLDELRNQKNDLLEASRTLRKTVEMLREQSVARFFETFELVRNNFVKIMPRLFGGGEANLELMDPANPLESGIEIKLRPPGKKPKSIDLLSGGEKALSATALIVSLFLVRPSPLCILDEVDAPLDEANLVRFLSLVKDMSKQVQFLVITHNKASMAASDRLVGVTMQQPGASSVLTVSLEEAYEQVA